MDVIRICRVNTVSRKQLKTQQEEHGVTGQHNKTTLHTSITSAAHQHGTKKKKFICTAKRSADNQVSLSESVGPETGETTARTHKQSSCCGATGSKGLWELWDSWASKQVDETHLIH